jgi:hypothetical protein
MQIQEIVNNFRTQGIDLNDGARLYEIKSLETYLEFALLRALESFIW